jgi:hypothetical protein
MQKAAGTAAILCGGMAAAPAIEACGMGFSFSWAQGAEEDFVLFAFFASIELFAVIASPRVVAAIIIHDAEKTRGLGR